MWSIKELLLFCCSDSLREITSLWWVIDELTSNTIRPQVCGQPCWYPLVCCFLIWTVMSSQHFGSDSSGNVSTWQRPRAQSSMKCGVGLHRALIWTIKCVHHHLRPYLHITPHWFFNAQIFTRRSKTLTLVCRLTAAWFKQTICHEILENIIIFTYENDASQISLENNKVP